MEKGYYTLPLQLGKITEKKQHEKCSLRHSIAQKIHLITTTHFGECRFDPDFGCSIWETDFEILPNVNQWRDKMMASIKDTIAAHEPRLQNVKVTLSVNQEEFMISKGETLRRVKRRIELKLQATITQTNEPFEFSNLFYFSPISFD